VTVTTDAAGTCHLSATDHIRICSVRSATGAPDLGSGHRCGIVGYTGERKADGVILEGPGHLDYRGYCSTGICVSGPDDFTRLRADDNLRALRLLIEESVPTTGTSGIRRTRCATRGSAHPRRGDLAVGRDRRHPRRGPDRAVVSTTAIGVTNMPDSQLTRDVDRLLLTRAGSEMSVAATKTFATQVALLALEIGGIRGPSPARQRNTHSSSSN